MAKLCDSKNKPLLKEPARRPQARRPYDLRQVDGIVNIDKPYGLSSNQVLQKVKSIFRAKKAGHTGNLDPLATGVLPICLGHATKVSQYLLDSDKCYQAGIILGENTTTGDKEGETVGDIQSANHLSRQEIEAALLTFKGKQQQMPPMFSALKYQGQPLYKLARQGITVERPSRGIEIYDIQLINFNLPEIVVQICCSKGTYIRTLAEDIGKYFNLGAHLSSLRRTHSGTFTLENSIELEQLKALRENTKAQDINKQLDSYLSPIDSVLEHYPKAKLNSSEVEDIMHGRQIVCRELFTEKKVTEKIVTGKTIRENNESITQENCEDLQMLQSSEEFIRLYTDNETFLGLAVIKSKDSVYHLQPKRLFIT